MSERTGTRIAPARRPEGMLVDSDFLMNKVSAPAPAAGPNELRWNRDPVDEADRGQVDLPRLEQGNVALQVFNSVAKSPSGQNHDGATKVTFDTWAMGENTLRFLDC